MKNCTVNGYFIVTSCTPHFLVLSAHWLIKVEMKLVRLQPNSVEFETTRVFYKCAG